MAEKRLLPRETRNYVPKFLAAAIIGRNMGSHSLLAIEQAIRLSAAEALETTVEEISDAISYDYSSTSGQMTISINNENYDIQIYLSLE